MPVTEGGVICLVTPVKSALAVPDEPTVVPVATAGLITYCELSDEAAEFWVFDETILQLNDVVVQSPPLAAPLFQLFPV